MTLLSHNFDIVLHLEIVYCGKIEICLVFRFRFEKSDKMIIIKKRKRGKSFITMGF